MGKFNIFYEQLKAKMSGQPPMSLQDAMATLKAEQQAAAPEVHGEEAQNRLAYSQKCRDALMDRAAERIQKEAAWDKAVKRISKLTRKPDFTLSSGNGQWLTCLMKPEDTPENQSYNTTIALQAAICNHSIRMADASAIYQTEYAYDMMHVPEFSQQMQDDLYNAPTKLLNLLAEKFAEAQRQLPEFDSSADAVLSGEADDNTLQKSFRTLESDEIYLLQNAQGCLDDFKGFEQKLPKAYPGRIPADELEKRQKEWPIPNGKHLDEVREKAEQTADPSYALWNQKAQEEKVEPPQQAPEEPKAEAPQQAPEEPKVEAPEQAPEEPKVEAPQQAPE